MAEKVYNGPSADTWSLGIVLYAMVVGQLPWRLDDRGIIRDVNDLISAKFTIPSSASISKGKKPFIICSCMNAFTYLFILDCEDLIRRMVRADPMDRISFEEIARHPWVVKDAGRPIDFNGEVKLININIIN